MMEFNVISLRVIWIAEYVSSVKEFPQYYRRAVVADPVAEALKTCEGLDVEQLRRLLLDQSKVLLAFRKSVC